MPPRSPVASRTLVNFLATGSILVLGLLSAACITTTLEEDSDAASGLSTTLPIPVTTVAPVTSADIDAALDPEEAVVTTTTSTTEPPPTLANVVLEIDEVTNEIKEPVTMAFRPGETDMIYVAQRQGTVRRLAIQRRSRGRISYDLRSGYAIDLREETGLRTSSASRDDDEVPENVAQRGLRGMAISSDGRRIYLSYTNADGVTNVDEWNFDDDQVNERTRRTLLSVNTPLADVVGNNLAFGPDGFLYIALGVSDSSAGVEVAQDPTSLAGSVLRIDPEPLDEQSYVVPDGNPFVDDPSGAPEVFLYGVHQPVSLSWDSLTGDMWLADAGRDQRDEINFLPALLGAGRAANLGWDVFEGTRPIDPDVTELATHVPPAYEYELGDLCRVAGGTVYRGSNEQLNGVYVYGDACDSRLYGLVVDSNGTSLESGPIVNGPQDMRITSLAADPEGELYGLSLEQEQIFRFVTPEPPDEDEESEEQ